MDAGIVWIFMLFHLIAPILLLLFMANERSRRRLEAEKESIRKLYRAMHKRKGLRRWAKLD